MSSKRISDMPLTKPRKSQYELDSLIQKLSAINNPESEISITNDYTEALLCLANEIKDLKSKL